MMANNADLSFAESLAREAGRLLMRYQAGGFAVAHKGSTDLVTTADRESEQLIVRAISARYPAHAIIGEESGMHGAGGHEVWYIDPLDGTTSFVHGYPSFAVSIALYSEGAPALAVVYDPTRDELFSARRGAGSRLNGEPIGVSQAASLIESLLTSGFPYDVGESGRNVDAYLRLTLLTRGVRVSGSSALDLSWLACGRLDGYWEPDVKPWDGAAGVLLAREAGGRVSDLSGRDWQPDSGGLVASNGRLHSLLLREVS